MYRRKDRPPPQPPPVYNANFGPAWQYVAATIAWATYWKTRPHVFKLCQQCPECELCFDCAQFAWHPVHLQKENRHGQESHHVED